MALNDFLYGIHALKIYLLTYLLAFLDKVTDLVDSGNSIDVVFLDFAKAFDKMPHSDIKD